MCAIHVCVWMYFGAPLFVCHAVYKCVTGGGGHVSVCMYVPVCAVRLSLANANGHIMMNWLHDFS